MSGAIPCPCPRKWPHNPHFYVSVIVGGAPGPLPTAGFVCPGVADAHD